MWLRIDEAALALGVSERTLWRWMKQGAPRRKVRGMLYVDPAALTEWKRRSVIPRRLRHARKRLTGLA